MKIEIRVGDTSTKNRVKFDSFKMDDVESEKKRMYEFLSNCKDCIIEDVDNFLIYTLNNGLMRYYIKDHEELKNDECVTIPEYNPDVYKVVEILLDGTEISIQEENGYISKNYFNKLMGGIMDDYYKCLNFY